MNIIDYSVEDITVLGYTFYVTTVDDDIMYSYRIRRGNTFNLARMRYDLNTFSVKVLNSKISRRDTLLLVNYFQCNSGYMLEEWRNRFEN